MRENRSCKNDDKLTFRSGSAGSNAFSVLANEAQASPLAVPWRWSKEEGPGAFLLEKAVYFSGSVLWGPSEQDDRIFWVLVVSDESFHLFKQGTELSAARCRHRAILLLAIHARTVQSDRT